MRELDKELLLATKRNASHAIELLIKGGANPNIMSGALWRDYELEGFTPLMIAAKNNSVVCLNVLLEYGADINYRHQRLKSSALSQAAKFGNIESVKLLLSKGAKVANADLVSACSKLYSGKIETIKLLIEAGCNINSKNYKGETALIRVVKANYDNIDDIRCLLNHGAGINIKNHKGFSAIDYAIKLNRKDVIQILDEYNIGYCLVKYKNNDADGSGLTTLFSLFTKSSTKR